MNGLILFIGESFRLGGQGTRNRGSKESYDEQMKACDSHIHFIENIIKKFQMNSISVYISSYNTQFDNDLISKYEKYLIGKHFQNNLIGIDGLFHRSIKQIKNIEKYDFVLYIRIDLFLKQYFSEVFNPRTNMILFPTICWILCHKVGSHPRVNDMLLFIPNKYYKYFDKIFIGHETWYHLMYKTDLDYSNMDTIIHTYHDSDSCKDFNPLYYIVNRGESTVFHSNGFVFDKNNFT